MVDETSAVVERQLIVFNVDGEEFGFDIDDVREIIKMVDITKVPDISEHFKGIINLRGNIISVIDLAKKLKLASKENDGDTRIIVVEAFDNTVGLLVDSVSEVLRIKSDKIEDAPQLISDKIHIDYIEGVGIVDKRLIILIDIKKMLGTQDIEQIKKLSKKEN